MNRWTKAVTGLAIIILSFSVVGAVWAHSGSSPASTARHPSITVDPGTKPVSAHHGPSVEPSETETPDATVSPEPKDQNDQGEVENASEDANDDDQDQVENENEDQNDTDQGEVENEGSGTPSPEPTESESPDSGDHGDGGDSSASPSPEPTS